MATFHTAVSSKLTSDIYTRNGWDYKVEIVQQVTYDTKKVDNETLIVIGRSFDSREEAEKFVKSKVYKKIEKVAAALQTEL